ncbi:MAG: metal-binding protein [Oscillochloridaceae bacterium umkhey_bin13]
MPDARTHDLITVATGIVMVPFSYGYFSEAMLLDHSEAMNLTLWLVGAHLISGILFSPDLDIDSAIDNRWGIFYWIWRPYMRIIPHRHFWSHSLIFAPLLRLAYFYGVVSGLLFLWVWLLAQLGLVVDNFPLLLFAWIRNWWAEHTITAWVLLVGFCTGSAAHTIADWLVTNGQALLRMVGIRVRRNYRGHR